MNPSDARILMGRSWEERLPSKMNVHGEFPESLSSWWYPDSFIAQVGFIFLAEESEGGKILGFLGTCDPKLSSLDPHLSNCTDWWLSNPRGLCPRNSGLLFSHQSDFLARAQETGCAPANCLKVLSAAGPDSREVVREAEVWRDNTDYSLAPGV